MFKSSNLVHVCVFALFASANSQLSYNVTLPQNSNFSIAEPLPPKLLPNRNVPPEARTTSKLCTLTSYDTMFADNQQNVYVFAGPSYYHLNEYNPQPRAISSMWPGLPEKVHASFTTRAGETYFFKDDQCWKYDATQRLVAGFPRIIQDEFPGLPSDVNATTRNAVNILFVYKETQCWTYDLTEKQVLSVSSTRSLSSIKGWHGVPTSLSDAFPMGDVGYFFSGFLYYDSNVGHETTLKVKDVRSDWFYCLRKNCASGLSGGVRYVAIVGVLLAMKRLF